MAVGGLNRVLRAAKVFSYHAYNLPIASEFPFPGLAAATKRPVIFIRQTDLSRSLRNFSDWQSIYDYSIASKEDSIIFYWKNQISALIKGDSEIRIEPAPGLDERIMRLVLWGPVFSALLQRRNYLVLHASAVQVSGHAAAFLGEGGMGKSTLAAFMQIRGHRFISDNLSAIVPGDVPYVCPAPPVLKLTCEALSALGKDCRGLESIEADSHKRYWTARQNHLMKPLPLKRLYFLEKETNPAMRPVGRREALFALVRHSHPCHYFKNEYLPGHFKAGARLSAGVPARFLARGSSFAALPEVARLIEKDVADE